MKIKIPKLRFLKIFLSLRVIFILVIIIFIAIVGYLGWFLYNNLYQTIAQTEQIIVLRAEVSPYSIDIKQFNTILETLEKKTSQKNLKKINWSEIKNPFGFTSASGPVNIRID